MFTKHPTQVLPYHSGNPGPHPQEALALSEPNPAHTLVVQIAQHLEHLAATDDEFDTDNFGDQFLRQFTRYSLRLD
ncbi:hypothetical protein UCDDA912_g04721 [Diaporthe ampelina]|uniref:Uncharacterized protein n=1 Tax=Diaporthe ampelina TaxID=1214573 RepID=A0A0G2FMQ0_9PEZI|nr:hypothetical protein UCDDA912_g04721 [Diaporthe ampelina]